MSDLRHQKAKRLAQRRQRRLALLTLTIDWQTTVTPNLLSPKALRAAALAWQGWGKSAVNVLLVSSTESQQLNAEWRGKDKPTNVLSFPFEMPEGLLAESEELLGDLVICPEVLVQEALDQHKSLAHHFAHMLVHGMLHLQGYDHEDDNEAQVMEQMEIDILRQVGLENPYLQH